MVLSLCCSALEPQTLLDVNPKHKGQQGELELLLKWNSLLLYEATWEDFSLVSTQFPEFHLEDKVKVWAGGNVRPEIKFHINEAQE